MFHFSKFMKFVFFLLCQSFPLKTGIPVEERDSILKLVRRVSHPEIQLGVGFYGIYFPSQEQIAYFLLRKLSTSSFISNFSECCMVSDAAVNL